MTETAIWAFVETGADIVVGALTLEIPCMPFPSTGEITALEGISPGVTALSFRGAQLAQIERRSGAEGKKANGLREGLAVFAVAHERQHQATGDHQKQNRQEPDHAPPKT